MIRATLDVNVLVSAFPATGGTLAALIAHWNDVHYNLVLSEHIINGMVRAWDKPYFKPRFAAERVEQTIRLLRVKAIVVEPPGLLCGIGEDEEDDLVVETAVVGNSDYLVTGDKHMQGLGRHQGVTVLSPRQFLALLETEILAER